MMQDSWIANMRFCCAAFLLACINLSASDAQESSPSLRHTRDVLERIPAYRKIITDSLAADPEHSEVLDSTLPFRRREYSTTRIFLNPRLLAPFEISGIRWVESRIGWAWLACLKVNYRNRPLYYAIFIQHEHVVDTRGDVAIDQCRYQSFTPLHVKFPPLKRTGIEHRSIY